MAPAPTLARRPELRNSDHVASLGPLRSWSVQGATPIPWPVLPGCPCPCPCPCRCVPHRCCSCHRATWDRCHPHFPFHLHLHIYLFPLLLPLLLAQGPRESTGLALAVALAEAVVSARRRMRPTRPAKPRQHHRLPVPCLFLPPCAWLGAPSAPRWSER